MILHRIFLLLAFKPLVESHAQAEVARETPEALLQPGCDCLYCQNLKTFCEARRAKCAFG
jgi:hypothetical protein